MKIPLKFRVFFCMISSFFTEQTISNNTSNTLKTIPYHIPMKNFFFITIFLVISGISYAQTQPLSLRQAIAQALERNPQVQNVALNQRKSGFLVKEQKSIALPQISASISYEDNLKLATQLLPGELMGQPGRQIPVQFGTKYNISTGIELHQMVYNQAYWAGLKAIKKVGELDQLQIAQTKEDLAFQVAQAYYVAQITGKQREILTSNILKINKIITITEAQYKNGLVQKNDLDRLHVSQTNLQTEVENLETVFQQQLNMLKYLTATSFEQNVVLIDSIQSLGISTKIGEQPNFQNRISMRLLNNEKEMEALQIKVVQAGYYPSIGAYARYNYQAQRNEWNFFDRNQSWFDFSSVGLRVNIPIFDGFQKTNKIQQHKTRLEQINLRGIIQQGYLQMEHLNSANKLRNQESIIKKQNANVQLAETVYQTTQTQYQGGVTSLADLLNAETSLREAQTNYFTTLVQAKIAELEYIKSNGNLLEILN